MPTCGTIYAYNEGCRCERCRFAVAEAKRRQRGQHADAVVRLLFRDRPDWYAQAACKGNTEIMYDISGQDRALAICAGCEVRDPCRAQARADREQGTWGGETEVDRHRLGRGSNINVTARNRLAREEANG